MGFNTIVIKKNKQSPNIIVNFTNLHASYTSLGVNLGVFFTNKLELHFTGGGAFREIHRCIQTYPQGTHDIDDKGKQKFISGDGITVILELMKTLNVFRPIKSEYACCAKDILEVISMKIKNGTELWVVVNLLAGEMSLPINADNCQHWNCTQGLFTKYLKYILDANTRGK